MFPLFNIVNINVSQFNIKWYHEANVVQRFVLANFCTMVTKKYIVDYTQGYFWKKLQKSPHFEENKLKNIFLENDFLKITIYK